MEKEIEQILNNLNEAFEPITNEIDTKLKFLQNMVDDERDLSFKKLSIEDIIEK